MAILQKIRNRAGVFIIIFVGVALFLFVVDPTTFSVLFERQDTSIARIDNRKVEYEEFLDYFHKHERFYLVANRLRSLDAEMTEAIREQAWNDILRDYILKDYFEEVGLNVSEEELEDLLYGSNIHSVIQQNFTNPETGTIDTLGVRSFFSRADETLETYIIAEYFRDVITRDRISTKYSNMVAQGFYEPALLAKKDYMERNTNVDFNFIVKYYNVIDDDIAISEDEIKDYYNENLYKYMIDEDTRDIEYVVFEAYPSSEDTLAAKNAILAFYDDFVTTDEPIEFVDRFSDFTHDNIFYREDEMPKELEDDFFHSGIGSVSEILLSDSSYFAVRIVDYVSRPDSVNASHILLQPNQQMSMPAVYALADSLKQMVLEGANFSELAAIHSQDPGSQALGGNLGWFQEGVMVPEFNDACFENEIGDIVIVETQFGVHIIKIINQSGFYNNVKLAFLHSELTWSERTFNKVFSRASTFSANSPTATEFDQNVMTHNYVKRIATDLKELDSRIPGIENPREIVRWVYSDDVEIGDVSDVFLIDDKFIVAKLAAIRETGPAPIEDVMPAIRETLLTDKKADILKNELSRHIDSGLSLQDIAERSGAEIISATSINFNSFSIPQVGVEPSVVAIATSINPNTISPVIQGNRGVYVLEVTNINEAPEKSSYVQEQLDIMRRHSSRAAVMVFQALQDRATIEDNRTRWF